MDISALESNVYFKDLQTIVHEMAKDKGWWLPAKTFGEQVVLMHAELSEAIEEYRDGHEPDEIYLRDTVNLSTGETDTKPEGVPIEFSDVVIRIMDTCEFYGIDLWAAIIQKVKYNESRSYRHGNKVI